MEKRGLLSDFVKWMSQGAKAGIDDMDAALSGYRIPQGAVLTDAGYVMPEDIASGRYDVAAEREPDVMRAMELLGGAMSPARTGAIAAKAGMGGKASVAAANALPMDEASRMARASETGYTIDAYHGTKRGDISAFDSALSGANSGNPTGAFSFSSSPDVAGTYAMKEWMDAPTEAYSKLRDAVSRLMARGKYRDVESLNADFSAKYPMEHKIVDGSSTYPVKLRMSNPLVIDAKGKSWRDIGGRDINDIAREAMESGNDGLIVNNVVDAGTTLGMGATHPSTTYMVFDPKNVRSRFATFDQSQSDSAGLLSARGPMTVPRDDERGR